MPVDGSNHGVLDAPRISSACSREASYQHHERCRQSSVMKAGGALSMSVSNVRHQVGLRLLVVEKEQRQSSLLALRRRQSFYV